MEKEVQNRILQKVQIIQILLLFALMANGSYFFAVLWYVIADPNISQFVPIDRSHLLIISIGLLLWLSFACLQTVILLLILMRAKMSMDSALIKSGKLLGRSWTPWPVGMPICIVSENPNEKVSVPGYFAVIPLDLSKLAGEVLNPKAQMQEADLQILLDSGTGYPLCFLGEEQSFVICWKVPKMFSVRKIDA